MTSDIDHRIAAAQRRRKACLEKSKEPMTLARKLRLKRRAHFHGRLLNSLRRNYYALADLLQADRIKAYEERIRELRDAAELATPSTYQPRTA